MKINPLGIRGAWLIESPIFSDNRGLFREWFAFDMSEWSDLPKFDVKQANTSVSSKGVIRGIHFSSAENGQSKIVTCTSGSCIDAIVDLRESSETFGKSITINLDSKKSLSIYISKGLGHGFQALENETSVTYLLDRKYDPTAEFTINPLDQDLAINWENIPAVLSDKDKSAPSFQLFQELNIGNE